MARGTYTDDEIAMVRAALARLRGLKPFRGQGELVRDAEEHLARMVAERRARLGGSAQPRRPPEDEGPAPSTIREDA